MAVRISSSGNSATLNTVEKVEFNTQRNINTYVFTDDTASILDEGKNIDQVVLTGVLKSSGITTSGTINDIMDDQMDVELSGMDDSNLNTEYIIKDFSISQGRGEGASDLYHYTLTLERLRDRLPYSEL